MAALTIQQWQAVEDTCLILGAEGVLALVVGVTGIVIWAVVMGARRVAITWRQMTEDRQDTTGGVHRVNPQAWDLVELANSVERVRGIGDSP